MIVENSVETVENFILQLFVENSGKERKIVSADLMCGILAERTL